MSTLAREGLQALRQGNFKKLGTLVDESWKIKKKFASGVSNPKVDAIYDKAIKAGALGGKISGAGSGGFFTLIVEPAKKKAVRSALKDYEEVKVNQSIDGSKVIFNIRN